LFQTEKELLEMELLREKVKKVKRQNYHLELDAMVKEQRQGVGMNKVIMKD
jgi:cell shape-determining protein MreC